MTTPITQSSGHISETEAIESIVFRAREGLRTHVTTAGREVYHVSDLVSALNDILTVARAARGGASALSCNCDVPDQVQCDAHGSRE